MEKALKTEKKIEVTEFCKAGLVLEQRVKDTDKKILHDKGETYNPDDNIVCFTYIDKVSNIIQYTTVARQADNNKDGVTSEISVLTLEKNLRNSKLFKDVKAEYIKSSDELGNPVNTFQYELKINDNL
jgi:hypothetical protein